MLDAESTINQDYASHLPVSRFQLLLLFKRRNTARAGACSCRERRHGSKILAETRSPSGYNDGYDARTLRELLEIVETNKDRIERAWNEFSR